MHIKKPILTDHAILQHSHTLPIEGSAKPDTLVEFFLDSAFVGSTAVAPEGTWRFLLPSQIAGGPHKLVIRSDDEELTFEDLYFGDVFLLAGQSNMELPVKRCLDVCPYETLQDPLIRELRLPHEISWKGIDPAAEWKLLDKSGALEFSALGVAFAWEYRKTNDVPVGLINVALGGTPIVSWLPVDVDFDPEEAARITQQDIARMEAWYDELAPIEDAWRAHEMPGMFFDTPWENKRGKFELRFEFDLEHTDYTRLDLGAFVDHDVTYLNGVELGSTPYQYPPRKYAIPDHLLRQGKNELMVELYIQRDTGGAIPERDYVLRGPRGTKDLSGTWYVRRLASQETLPYQTFHDRTPGINWHHFIEPLTEQPLKGVLWYQGESDDRAVELYEARFKGLITTYQELFHAPLVFCQLAHFADPTRIQPPGAWSKLRAVQERSSHLDRASQVVHYDVTTPTDLHPEDKWSIGERAAKHMLYLLGGSDERGPKLLDIKKPPRSLHLIYDKPLELRGDLRMNFRVEPDLYPVEVSVFGNEVHLDFSDLPNDIKLHYMEEPEVGKGIFAKGEPASPFYREV